LVLYSIDFICKLIQLLADTQNKTNLSPTALPLNKKMSAFQQQMSCTS